MITLTFIADVLGLNPVFEVAQQNEHFHSPPAPMRSVIVTISPQTAPMAFLSPLTDGAAVVSVCILFLHCSK